MYSVVPPEVMLTGGASGAWYYILNRDATAQLLSERMQESADAFDPNEVFTNSKKAAFDEIYRASADTCRTSDYTAEGTLDGKLKIRRVS